VDHDWVVAFDVEDADLEQCSVCCWAYEHRQVVVEVYSSHRVANGMPYVRVDDPVLSRWLTDPHLDNIACLEDDIVDRTSAPVGYATLSAGARTTAGFAQRTVLSTSRAGARHPLRRAPNQAGLYSPTLGIVTARVRANSGRAFR
jgi:hypothetical protein